MARIRSTKPEFWDDRKLARMLTRDARMLYMGLWNQADEHARCNGDPHWIKGRVFPYDDDLTDVCVAGLLDQLAAAGRIVVYEVDGDPYLFLPKLGDHQRLEPGKVESRHPAPPDPGPAGSPPADADPGAAQTSPNGSAPRADETAPDVDKSALLYVAGSMEHGAGCMEHGACSSGTREDERRADEPPPPPSPPENPDDPRLDALRVALTETGMTARWDKLRPDDRAEVLALIDAHGIPRLVAEAQRRHRPDDPAAFATAWIGHWRTMRPPTRLVAVADRPPVVKLPEIDATANRARIAEITAAMASRRAIPGEAAG